MDYLRWIVDFTDYPILKIFIIVTTVGGFLALVFKMLDKIFNNFSVKQEKQHTWKEKITKQVVLISIATVMFLSGSYWIFVRPTYARKDCNKKALDYAKNTYSDTYNTSKYEQFYKICLRNKGI